MPLMDSRYILAGAELFKAFDTPMTIRVGGDGLAPVYFEGSTPDAKLMAVIMPMKKK